MGKNKVMTSLSILMPTYNNVCVGLVETLHAQCERIAKDAAGVFSYEIIVADDGSTDCQTKVENRKINTLDHCRFIERKVNSGRSAIRNFLAKESNKEWLLFIDSDVAIGRDNFVLEYVCRDATEVICGGVTIGQDDGTLSRNLRYRYEKAEAHKHTAEARRNNEHKCFRTTNFKIRRDIMLANLFDETITAYGYEDVIFGKRLCEKGIGIDHFDNPVVLADYEDNLRFVEKTEESLRTLFQLKERLSAYSTMLEFIEKIARFGLAKLLLAWHKHVGRQERKNLMGRNPNLLVFKLYKIGYYLSLENGNEN